MDIECESGLFAPVTVRRYVPAVDELKVTVAVPDPPGLRVTLLRFIEAVRPDGEVDVEREIVPLKPLRLVRVMLEVPEEPS